MNISGVGETGVGEMGQIIGEMGVGETGTSLTTVVSRQNESIIPNCSI